MTKGFLSVVTKVTVGRFVGSKKPCISDECGNVAISIGIPRSSVSVPVGSGESYE